MISSIFLKPSIIFVERVQVHSLCGWPKFTFHHKASHRQAREETNMDFDKQYSVRTLILNLVPDNKMVLI